MSFLLGRPREYLFNAEAESLLAGVLSGVAQQQLRFWDYYDELLAYNERTSQSERERLSAKFDELFSTKADDQTDYYELNERTHIARVLPLDVARRDEDDTVARLLAVDQVDLDCKLLAPELSSVEVIVEHPEADDPKGRCNVLGEMSLGAAERWLVTWQGMYGSELRGCFLAPLSARIRSATRQDPEGSLAEPAIHNRVPPHPE